MTRDVLLTQWPLLLALLLGCVFAAGLLFVSGARLKLARLRSLHRCQDGGVQSLAFVLTFPVFMMVVLFVVQVSQLIIAVMVVHGAAFASARAASVWTAEDFGILDESLEANEMPPLTVDLQTQEGRVLLTSALGPQSNPKLERPFRAAVVALAPICPSGDMGFEETSLSLSVAEAAYVLQSQMAPLSRLNDRLPARIRNKLAYAVNKTVVRVENYDRDSEWGPTYNPQRNADGLPPPQFYQHNPNEVGWRDPIKVTVTHEFGLLPGPGRFLAKRLVRSDGTPDTISPRIQGELRTRTRDVRPGQRRSFALYSTPITATCTLNNEGLVSTVPYYRESFR